MWAIETNNLEQNNILCALDIGISVPEFLLLKNLHHERIAEIKSSGAWVFQKDFALQKVDGIPLSVYGYYAGGEFKHKTLAIECKHLLSGDQGPAMDGNMITVFHEDCRLFDKYLKSLIGLIQVKDPELKGIIGISGYLSDKKVWYGKVHFGASEDFVNAFCALEGIERVHIKDYLNSMNISPTGKKFGASIRTWEWPNAGKFGYVTASEDTVKRTWTNIYEQLDGFDGCYRMDGGIIARRVYRELKEARYI